MNILPTIVLSVCGGENDLVGKSLSVEVNGVHVHFVAHAQQIPVDLLPLHHHQSMEVTVQLTVDPFNIHIDTSGLPNTHIITYLIRQRNMQIEV